MTNFDLSIQFFRVALEHATDFSAIDQFSWGCLQVELEVSNSRVSDVPR